MYSDAVAPSIAEVAGANARALRLAADVKLEDFAQAAQSYGLPWTTGRVGDFESGRAGPSLPTMFAVAAALGAVIDRPVSLAELFDGKGSVQINDGLTVKLSELRSALSGEAVEVKALPAAKASRPAGIKNWTASGMGTPRGAGDRYMRVLNSFRESDVRMCKNIGVETRQGAAAMATLWGHTFSTERDRQAGQGANAQRRGQISRQLKAALERELWRHGAG
jgi:transcriptional regulator with XRE-family HTH domain